MNRFRILIPAVFIILLTVFALPPARPPLPAQPASALNTAAELQITAEQRVTDLDVYLISPDGSTFLTLLDGQICTGGTDTFTVGNCVPVDAEAYIDRASVAWSPDNTRIAFTQSISDSSIHAIAYAPNEPAHDTDIWVLEISTGKLTDLTSVVGLGIPSNAAVDTQPAWSPDGKGLAFVRSDRRQTGNTALYTIHANGGKPRKLLTVNEAGAFSVIGKLDWTGDGRRIVYAVKYGLSALYPEDGIWIVDRDGKHPRHLTGNSARWNTPVLLGVSASNAVALIDYYWGYWSTDWTPNDCYVFLLDLNSGALTPLKEPASTNREFYSPLEAVFSPDGSKVLYFYIQYEKAERRLAVMDVSGGPEALLYTSQWALNSDFWHTYPSLFWSTNDTVYARTDFTAGWFLDVGSK